VAVAVTVVTPILNVLPEVISVRIDTLVQLSVAVVSNSTTDVHRPKSVPVVMSAGHVMTGASVSSTVTRNSQMVVPSEMLTVVVPTGKNDPDGGSDVMIPHDPEVIGAS